MSAFADTSGFFAYISRGDQFHPQARESFVFALTRREALITTNYVILETLALVQHRLGMSAVRDFNDDLIPQISIRYVGEELHKQAMEALLTADRRELSLVDCASFAVMRRLGLKRAIAFDAHFSEQGFHLYHEHLSD